MTQPTTKWLLAIGPAIALAVPLPAAGQQLPASTGTTAESEVLATVERVFEGMREADGAKVRSTLHQGARFTALDQEGPQEIIYPEVDAWVRAVGESNGRWDERIYDVEVRVDGDMASVWAPFTFYLDGQVLHCGVNSIELLRAEEGWKITQVSDSRREEACPDPLGADQGSDAGTS